MKHMTSHKDQAAGFTCPMHPEVKGNEGDECPKCGMKLESAGAEREVYMSLRTNPTQVVAGNATGLSFEPKDRYDSTATVALEEMHEKMIHVIVVNEDLSWFDHIHAEPSGKRTYQVNETFPAGGKYLVYADYKPKGHGNQADKIELNVDGAKGKTVHHEPNNIATTDGYTLTVINADSLVTGRVELPVRVEKDGRNLKWTDIENYLGAAAHIILMSQHEKEFIHIHPESSDEHPIVAHTILPRPGIYRMWVQFQTHGTVHTADFTLDVKQGTDQGSPKDEHAHAGHKH